MGRDAVGSNASEGAYDGADGVRTDATLASGRGIDPMETRDGGHTLGRITCHKYRQYTVVSNEQ